MFQDKPVLTAAVGIVRKLLVALFIRVSAFNNRVSSKLKGITLATRKIQI